MIGLTMTTWSRTTLTCSTKVQQTAPSQNDLG